MKEKNTRAVITMLVLIFYCYLHAFHYRSLTLRADLLRFLKCNQRELQVV
jgi:hypothetical protein